MQESMLKEYRGSQPPRQYAPTPHCPYCEQHGELEGQLAYPPCAPHCGMEDAAAWKEKVAASAAAALKQCRIVL